MKKDKIKLEVLFFVWWIKEKNVRLSDKYKKENVVGVVGCLYGVFNFSFGLFYFFFDYFVWV